MRESAHSVYEEHEVKFNTVHRDIFRNPVIYMHVTYGCIRVCMCGSFKGCVSRDFVGCANSMMNEHRMHLIPINDTHRTSYPALFPFIFSVDTIVG